MKKTLITILATVLICACVAGGTIAWLMDKTTPIENTFTVGNVDIELTETGTTEVDGVFTKEFKMVPGTEISKDPKVTVKGGSEDCYLFVKIDESADFGNYITYSVKTGEGGWTALDSVAGVYYCEVAASDADQEFQVLTGNDVYTTGMVTVKDTVTKAMADALKAETAVKPTLTFTAYAVQKANVADAATAWGYATAAANNS